MPDGKLRHYIKNPDDEDDFHQKHLEKDASPLYYDYEQGQYCMDKVKYWSKKVDDVMLARYGLEY